MRERRLDYLPPARAIFIAGFMGTGKTTNGRRLADRLGLEFADTDEVVQVLAGKSIPDIFEQDGEAAFRELETEALRAVLRGPRAVVSTGGGILLRPENTALMRSAGPVICLSARPETILRRTSRRGDRPLLRSSDPLATIRSLLDERRPLYDRADHQVWADGDDREVMLAQTTDALAADPRTALLVRGAARVRVLADNREYPIHIAAGALASLGRLCPATSEGLRCAVITTDVVGPLYGERVLDALGSGGWRPELITIPDGEASKTLETASLLYDHLADIGIDGAGAVFALGGGVVGDLAGFVAATYRRGIRLAHLPTTLLAQVDASVGGKVAVDHPRGKNLIGAFYQPAAVVIDSEALTTLPERELRSGLAEVIKHAAIADATMFEFLETEIEGFLGLDGLLVRYVLARNCQIKAAVVERDPYDTGVRACLNYGHTIGHAIERAAGDWDLRHGEAVAIGMAAEARLALRLGVCDEETVGRQTALLTRAGLPTSAPAVDPARAREALMLDKKIADGHLRIPVVPEIGSVRILEDVDPSVLCDVLTSVTDGSAQQGV